MNGLPTTATLTSQHLGAQPVRTSTSAPTYRPVPTLPAPPLTIPCVCGRLFLFPAGALRHACPDRDVALALLEQEDPS